MAGRPEYDPLRRDMRVRPVLIIGRKELRDIDEIGSNSQLTRSGVYFH